MAERLGRALMWWKHVLAFMLGSLAAIITIVIGIWVYVAATV